MNDDAELLRRYAGERAEAAFAEFVGRHIDLVYAAALRRMGGDSHRAHEVAQHVFIAAAKHAGMLARHASVSGWLYTATRNAAHNLMRDEQRRRLRENEARLANELLTAEPPATDWARLKPVLDAAMDELNERDREAVLLRYFEGRALADVGARLQLTENAARMRVERALEKLRVRLAGRGVTSTGAALGLMLAHEAVGATPASVTVSVTGAALASAASVPAAGPAAAMIQFMGTSKIAASLAAIVVVGTLGTTSYQVYASRDAEAVLALAQQGNDDLAAKLRELSGRADAAAVAAANAQKAREVALAAKASAAPSTAAVAAPRGPQFASAAEREALMVRYPEVRQAAIDYHRAEAAGTYGPLFKALGLAPEQMERFLDLATQGIGGRLAGQSLPYSTGGDRRAAQRELRELLGEDGYARYQNFPDSEGAAWGMTNRLAGALYRTTTPLAAEQANQLERILIENRPAVSGSASRSQYDWAPIMSRAQGILSARQLDELDHLRAQDEFSQAFTRSLLTAPAAAPVAPANAAAAPRK